MSKKKAPNEFFCLAPWTHTYISPQSERRLCCASREEHRFIHQYIDSSEVKENKGEYSPQTLEEYWNSKTVREVRKKMLKGEPPPECTICHNRELTLKPYKDYFTEELFPHLIEQAIESTDEEGYTSMRPRSYDYRFSNQCNFKCRMCGDLLSSSWEQEKRQHGNWNKESHPWMEAEINGQIKKFQKETVEKEFIQAIHRGEVEEIYWVGGEPLVWDTHWQVMLYLVESEMSKNVFIRYNTNLSKLEWRRRNLFTDLLPHFKGYSLFASIDAPGKVGEYIRTGLNWERWVKNLEQGLQYIDYENNQEIILDVTLTLPGLFALKEMFDFALEKDLPIEPKIVYAFDPTIAMSPLALPRELLDNLINDLIKYIFPRSTPKTAKLIGTLLELKKRPTHQEAFPDNWATGLKQGKEYLRYLEKIRGDSFTMEDIVSDYPEILKWWKNEQKA